MGKSVRKTDLVREAEQLLGDARLQLRAAAALHSFAVCGNDEMASRMMQENCPIASPVDVLADKFPAFRRYGELLMIASGSAA